MTMGKYAYSIVYLVSCGWCIGLARCMTPPFFLGSKTYDMYTCANVILVMLDFPTTQLPSWKISVVVIRNLALRLD